MSPTAVASRHPRPLESRGSSAEAHSRAAVSAGPEPGPRRHRCRLTGGKPSGERVMVRGGRWLQGRGGGLPVSRAPDVGQHGGGSVAGCQRADANVRRRLPHSARSSRPQPSRSATTSRRLAPRGRVHRVPPPRPSPRSTRPRSSRSSTASLFASRSAAARALVDGASLGALWSPPVRSELPAPHLGVRQGCAIRARGRACRNRLGRSG